MCFIRAPCPTPGTQPGSLDVGEPGAERGSCSILGVLNSLIPQDRPGLLTEPAHQPAGPRQTPLSLPVCPPTTPHPASNLLLPGTAASQMPGPSPPLKSPIGSF